MDLDTFIANQVRAPNVLLRPVMFLPITPFFPSFSITLVPPHILSRHPQQPTVILNRITPVSALLHLPFHQHPLARPLNHSLHSFQKAEIERERAELLQQGATVRRFVFKRASLISPRTTDCTGHVIRPGLFPTWVNHEPTTSRHACDLQRDGSEPTRRREPVSFGRQLHDATLSCRRHCRPNIDCLCPRRRPTAIL